MNEKEPWAIEACSHTYVTLYYDGRFCQCWDNDMTYAQDIIKAIEKRTGQKITEIKNLSPIDAYSGFRFLGMGFRNFITQEA